MEQGCQGACGVEARGGRERNRRRIRAGRASRGADLPRISHLDPGAAAAPAPGGRVLFVDPEEPAIAAFESALRAAGFECSKVQDAQAAVDAVTRFDFDVVVHDVSRHRMSATALVLRLTEVAPETFSILIVPPGSVEAVLAAVRAGAVDCLVKPPSPADLEARVRALRQERTRWLAVRRTRRRGNIRELENVIERCLVLGDGRWIHVQDLPPEIAGLAPEEASDNLKEMLRICERHHIETVLAKTDQDKVAAAKLLGISLSSLYRKLEELGISTAASSTDLLDAVRRESPRTTRVMITGYPDNHWR